MCSLCLSTDWTRHIRGDGNPSSPSPIPRYTDFGRDTVIEALARKPLPDLPSTPQDDPAWNPDRSSISLPIPTQPQQDQEIAPTGRVYPNAIDTETPIVVADHPSSLALQLNGISITSQGITSNSWTRTPVTDQDGLIVVPDRSNFISEISDISMSASLPPYASRKNSAVSSQTLVNGVDTDTPIAVAEGASFIPLASEIGRSDGEQPGERLIFERYAYIAHSKSS